MENILILDTETTGLDSKTGKLLEVGAILYNIPSRAILSQVSTLLKSDANPAFDINKISVLSLQKIPDPIQQSSFSLLMCMIMEADALVAHNAEFDKKWLYTVIGMDHLCRNKKWICTKNDVVWPVRRGTPLNLIHICAALECPIVSTHRALTDCALLLSAIESIEDIDYFLDKSAIGKITYYANVNYEQRQLVKDFGFMWDNVKKVWHAKLTAEEAEKLPFKVYSL